MSIKNILCAYSGEAGRGSSLRHAIKLAQHHDAYLTGVLRHGPLLVEERLKTLVPESALQPLRDADAAMMAEVRERFVEMTTEAGLADQADFVELKHADVDAVADYARPFDIVVTGTGSDLASEAHVTASPDLLALRSGRPVLVVPTGYDAPSLAENAVVAWDGKRSAARAIGDAMPYLEDKASVTLVTVSGTPAPGTQVLLRNLARHGITATTVRRERHRSVAGAILEAAHEANARLIVMGAFEHSKFSHDLWGGVTTDVIRDADVPVFMSH